MGIRSRIRTLAAGDQSLFGNTVPPPYGTAPTPVDQIAGTTPPEPDPGTIRPRVNQAPLGASGRANFYGLPQPDETNNQLIGPQGLRNFDLMYRTDPDIRRLVLMCWAPIVAGTWSLEPYGGDNAKDLDREIADTCWWALTKHMSPGFFEHLNTVGPVLLRSGFCPFEQIWQTVDHQGKTLIMPRKLDLRLPRSVWRWWQDDFGELTHIGQILPNKADVVIPASELVYYRLAAEGDNWVGTSLLRHAYKPWVMKDRLERIDAIGQERKAVGVPIVYPPENADDDTRSAVETVLANLHTNEVGYVVMPGPAAQFMKDMAGQQGWHIDVIKFDSSSGTGIQDSLKYHRDGIASAFLGDFMQLGHHAVGARATAEVQEDPFLTAVEALATFIVPPLDRLVARMVELNWPQAEGPPSFSMQITDAASLTEIASYVTALVAAGVLQADPELEDWLRARADLPPANPDVRKQSQDQQAAQQAVEQAAAKAAVASSEGKPSPPAKPAPAGNPKTQQLDQGEAEPTAKWWETLLSQDRLREALDGCRAHIEQAARQPALNAAAQAAHQIANGGSVSTTPPDPLVQALATHLSDMHLLGRDTARAELNRQRQALQLDTAPGTLPAPSVLQRAERAARTIMERIVQKLEQWVLNHSGGPPNAPQAQQIAEQAAVGALHEIALDYTASQINEGRQEIAPELGAVGAYRTAVLDNNTCKHCASQDTGQLLSLPEVLTHPLPDPECAGGDRCRCTYVYVLADDPAAAIAAGLG